ncbi:MAG TPA: hypothetical protein VF549_16215 [Solirubrobacteraceae bacterium]
MPLAFRPGELYLHGHAPDELVGHDDRAGPVEHVDLAVEAVRVELAVEDRLAPGPVCSTTWLSRENPDASAKKPAGSAAPRASEEM